MTGFGCKRDEKTDLWHIYKDGRRVKDADGKVLAFNHPLPAIEHIEILTNVEYLTKAAQG